MFEVENKVIIVTGGSGGLGSAICEALYDLGAVVYNIDITEPKNKDIAFIKTDLTKHKDLINVINVVNSKHKKIDGLVNCAAITGKPWEDVIAVNLTAPYKLITLVTDYMKERKMKGSIVNIGSLNAIVALPNNPMYIASKGGIAAMTRSFAVDLAKYGIRVNCVHPGYFETQMNAISMANPELRAKRTERIALGRWGKPKEIAPPVIFLLSDSASYVTGAELRVDGGWTIKGLS